VHRFGGVPGHEHHLFPPKVHRNVEEDAVDTQKVAKLVVAHKERDIEPDFWWKINHCRNSLLIALARLEEGMS
jgi:hypothetical protein